MENQIKPSVEIYTKEDCHLCDEAKEVLNRVKKSYPFDLIEVDITSNAGILNKYKEEIPVIFINKRKAFKFTVTEKEFIKKLSHRQL